jgi:lipopolysaccharide transport system ATP-binding protein
MSDTVIRVENLSKKYLLDHQQEGRSNYKSIRETWTNGINSIGKKILNPRSHQGFKPSQEEFWALKDVSFEIKQGDRVGIIGRNGAGKSTLLKILSRITEPTSGRIGINGRIASLLEVGTGFHPELTGRENIFLNGAILGMSQVEIKRKFDEIVDFAEVEKFLDTPVKRYSSGMYVRLAFAVAAHLEPEILIVDEVLAVGDLQFQKKCLGKMENISQEGRTILFVSHQIAAINQLCDRVVWLDQGQVSNQGTISEIIPEYLAKESSDLPVVTLREQKDEKGICFTKITILDHQGNPSTDLDAKFPFTVCLNYEVSKPLRDIEMAIRIKTSEDAPVFTTIYSDYSDTSKMDKTNGSYTASVRIPELFLMPGNYTISFATFQFKNSFNLLKNHENVIRFRVLETGTKIAKYYDHRNIGVVLVNLPWKDEKHLKVKVFS